MPSNIRRSPLLLFKQSVFKKYHKQEVFMGRFVSFATIVGVAAIFLTTVPLYAQTNDPGIRDRMENQEKHIDQGVQGGQLTPRETGRLDAERREQSSQKNKTGQAETFTG